MLIFSYLNKTCKKKMKKSCIFFAEKFADMIFCTTFASQNKSKGV